MELDSILTDRIYSENEKPDDNLLELLDYCKSLFAIQFSSIQSLSHVQFFATPWMAALTQTHVHWVNDAIQPSHPLLYPSPQSFPASGSFPLWVSSSHQVAEVLEFQLQHQSSNEHPGLISFRMDWLDLLAVQRTLKSLLQHHSSKVSILSAQLSSQSNSHIHTFHSLLLYSNNHNLLKIINLFYIHRLTWSHNPELFEGQIYFNDFQIVRVDIKCLLV